MVSNCKLLPSRVDLQHVVRVQQQSEKMDDQQSDLGDLKLKFQESEAARENRRG